MITSSFIPKHASTMICLYRSSLTIYTILFLSCATTVFANFPLDEPCLSTCAIDDISITTLQKCIDLCNTSGHICGNRLNGECSGSSDKILSCAHGCEIAYYRSSIDQCKSDCSSANQINTCSYSHPNIVNRFDKCDDCLEGNDESPDLDACSDGCTLAANLPEFYQYVEIPEETCNNEMKPRFLFAGQSNMVR